MLTLPSYFTTNLARRSVFIVRMTVVDAGTTKYLYMSSADLRSLEILYDGDIPTISPLYLAAQISGPSGGGEYVQGVGEVDISLDVQGGGGISSQGETTLVFLNQGGLMSSDPYDLENQPVEIWEVPWDGSAEFDIVDAGILRFRGVMRNAAQYDATRWTVQVVDRRVVDTRTLPLRKLNRADFPKLPADAVGRASQIVLGAFSVDSEEVWANFPLPLVPLHLVDENALKFLVAEHAVESVGAVVYKDQSGLQGVFTASGAEDLAGPSTKLLSDSGVRSERRVEFKVYPTLKGGYYLNNIVSGDWTAAVDGDGATYASLAGGAGGGYFCWTFNEYQLAAKVQVLNTFTPYDVTFTVDTWNRVGSPKVVFGLRSKNTVVEGTAFTAAIHSEQLSFTTLGWGALTIEALLNDLEIGIKCPAGASVDVYGIWLTFHATAPNVGRRGGDTARKSVVRTFGHNRASDTLFAALNTTKVVETAKASPVNTLAAVTGPTMGSALTSGRSNGWLSTETIENPAYAIEWILRDRLGLGSGDIDVASFDAVGHKTTGKRAGWKLATVVNRQVDAFDLIRDICFEFGLQFFVANSGKYKLVAMDDGDSVLTLTSSHVAFDEAVGPMVSLSVTPNDAISNDLYLNFALDFQTNEATKDVYLSDIDGDGGMETNISADSGSPWGGSYSDFVNDSRVRYRAAKAVQTTLEHIQDPTTAEAALKKLASWVCFQRLILKASLVRSADSLKLEPGDIIKADLDLLPATHRDSTKFLVTRVNSPGIVVVGGSPYINIEAEEIPNATTGLPVTTARYISAADLSVV
jgi:hypothetical protein